MMFDSRKKKDQGSFDSVRSEIIQLYQEFLEKDGRLPDGFSEPYKRVISGRYVIHETPFEPYLKEIWNRVDSLNNESGISEWLYLKETVDINIAVDSILSWLKRHRQMNDLLHKKCHINNTTIMLPVTVYGYKKIMVVMEDAGAFKNITAKSVEACKTANISFCTILSDRKLYDLIEQKDKEIQYVTYPNYHDETYADWYFV